MLISILRTVIPLIWGAIITTVIGVVPALEPLRDQMLAYGDLAVPFIAAFITALWYMLWRWVEPKLPNWLTAALLGSAQAPVYTASFDATESEATEPDYQAYVRKIIADEEEAEAEAEGKHAAE